MGVGPPEDLVDANNDTLVDDPDDEKTSSTPKPTDGGEKGDVVSFSFIGRFFLLQSIFFSLSAFLISRIFI